MNPSAGKQMKSGRSEAMEANFPNKNLVCLLILVILSSCNPQEELTNRVHGTLTAMPIPAGQLTYTDYPTYTTNPTYTIEKTTTLSPTASNTPDYTASAKPTSTDRPTQPLDGTGAITATWMHNHIPGQLFVDTNCGIRFEYPLEWMIEYANPGAFEKFYCFYGLRPNNYSQIVSKVDYCMGDYAIYLGVLNVNLEEAAGRIYIYYEDGYWVAHGMQGMSTDAQIISTRGLTILRARIAAEVWDKSCQARWGIKDYDIGAVNGGKNWSIVMWDEEATQFGLHFEYILQTIKII
jgi:hypothetical protein